MANVQTDQSVKLIFKGQAGDYYLVPRELMEQCRVSAEEKSEVERGLAGAMPLEAAQTDDTQAFVIPALPLVFLAGIAVGGAAALTGVAGAAYFTLK